MSLLQLQHVSFTYEGTYAPVFEDLNVQLDTDWKLGMVGRNGRGKTTLLRLLEGELECGGRIVPAMRCLRFPRPVQDSGVSVRKVLEEAAPEAEEWRLLRELHLLGLGEEVLERTFSTLSGGEQTRALLSALFLEEGGWPMLDEPTDHLDEEGRSLVAEYLRRSRRGFLLVSHDRDFLDACTDHTLALNRTGTEVLAGSFSVWRREKEVRDRREAAENDKLQAEIGRLQSAAKRTAAWSDQKESEKMGSLNSGLKPDRGFVGHRSAKMMKRSKNVQHRQEKAAEEKAGLLKDVERKEPLKLNAAVHFSQKLLELNDVSMQFGDRPVLSRVKWTLEQGERLCIAGGNGCGKSTLLKLILGLELPSSGTIRRAPGLELSYVPQQVEGLSGPLREFPDKEGIDRTQFLTILRKFDFPRAHFDAEMASFSAGQKKKVLLAASLCRTAHLYIWDEPLNFVDLFSRIQLEELILEAEPTMIFVEHDPAFRRHVATRTVRLD